MVFLSLEQSNGAAKFNSLCSLVRKNGKDLKKAGKRNSNTGKCWKNYARDQSGNYDLDSPICACKSLLGTTLSPLSSSWRHRYADRLICISSRPLIIVQGWRRSGMSRPRRLSDNGEAELCGQNGGQRTSKQTTDCNSESTSSSALPIQKVFRSTPTSAALTYE